MPSKFGINKLALILVAILAVFVIIQYGGLMPHRWQTYSSPDGAYSVEFPGKPSVETRQIPREGGGTLTLHFIHVQALGNRDYSCSYVEISPENHRTPDQVLESARDGSIRKVQGTVLTQNRLTYQGLPALQYQARTDKNMLMDSRMVVAGNRLYMLMAISGSGRLSETKTVQRMFDSLQLTPK